MEKYSNVLKEYFDQIKVIEENKRDIINELESNFAILYEHLLKFKFQKEEAGTSWVHSINYSSINILNIIDNKSNYNLLMYSDEKILSGAYKRGRNVAIKLTKLPPKTFPSNYYDNEDFSLEKILQRSYLKQYIIDHKPSEPHRQKIILNEVNEKFNDC